MKRLLTILLLSCVLFGYPVYSSNPYENTTTRIYFNKTAKDGVLELINLAKSTIDIQMYNFTNNKECEPVFTALKNAICRGVRIRIYIDNRGANNPLNANGTGFPEPDLENCICEPNIGGNCIVRWDNRSTQMHRKLAIIDDCYVWIGSTNWTGNGFDVNDEVNIKVESPDIATVLKGQFIMDWNSERTQDVYPGNESDEEP